jgi:GT2 family glycosyltransferase
VEIRKSISIIIPNFNNRSLLKEYLPYTCQAIKNADTTYEIIIVDDCSTDGSVEFIRSDYPQVVLVINPETKGSSYAYNNGIEIARYELILLLGAGIKLSPDYFEHQWKYFLRWDTFGVMGRIMDMEGDQIQEAARIPKFTGFKLNTDYVYYTNDSNNRLLTFYLPGANALINAEKLKQIGFFYELPSPFCGDMELSIRAWRLNWKCYYEHSAICKRQVSTNSKNDESGKLVENVYCRNLFYLHALHLNGSDLIGWYFQIIIIDLLPKLLIGQTWIWKSYKDLFRDRRVIKMYKERIKIYYIKMKAAQLFLM